jgi:hypothetical protein
MPVYPISFSIPESKIIKDIPKKKKILAINIPGDFKTYIFTNENSFNKDYQNSICGVTQKKGGWDCLRHYQILANGCIPYFIDLENCPTTIMTHFPKEIIIKAMNEVKSGTLNYNTTIALLLEYTRNNLTTKKMAEYVLRSIHITPKNILFLSGRDNPDYLQSLIFIGFKELYGLQCVEFPKKDLEHIYDDYEDSTHLCGKGFSYTNIIPANQKTDIPTRDDIKNKKYDLIIYGNAYNERPFWDLVNIYYKPSEIVLLCGDDAHDVTNCFVYTHGNYGYHSFIRELET